MLFCHILSISIRFSVPFLIWSHICCHLSVFFKAYFADYPSRLERFQSVYLSRRVENREIGGEFLGPLKTRLDAVGHEAPRRLEHLHHLQSHYMILAYLESLNQKMELWKSGNSASLVQRWIKEYKVISPAVFLDASTFMARCVDSNIKHAHELLGRLGCHNI